MTRVALPSMRAYRYSDRLATGTIAAGGTLGIMIPPSVPLVIYGIIAEQDIGTLFIAGIVPGLLLVTAFMLTVAIWTTLKPEAGPARTGAAAERKRGAGGSVIAVLLLFVFVLGGIYASVFTPTEAAGIGATGAAAIAFARGSLRSLSVWIEILVEASVTTAALFMIIFGTLVFAQFINLSGMPFDLMFLVEDLGLSPLGLVACIALIALLLGMIFESLGILLLIVPVFLPALIAADVDLIWFGIIVVMVTELGLITPPIGMNVFVVRSVMPDVRLASIFAGVMPFVAALIAVLVLILLFPAIATVLPDFANTP
jgi:tripartite ATP-independent transporter DctM subunit